MIKSKVINVSDDDNNNYYNRECPLFIDIQKFGYEKSSSV